MGQLRIAVCFTISIEKAFKKHKEGDEKQALVGATDLAAGQVLIAGIARGSQWVQSPSVLAFDPTLELRVAPY